MNPERNIPPQKSGGWHNTEKKICYSSEHISHHYFQSFIERLLSINNWKTYSGTLSAVFIHTDQAGIRVHRLPVQGDLICIKLPLIPGSHWVKIVEISHTEEAESAVFYMKCRPCPNPKGNNHLISHFYSKKATSNFCITKINKKIIIGVYGRNEIPNYKAACTDKILNFLIAAGGRMGIAKLQWSSLVQGLADYTIPKSDLQTNKFMVIQ